MLKNGDCVPDRVSLAPFNHFNLYRDTILSRKVLRIQLHQEFYSYLHGGNTIKLPDHRIPTSIQQILKYRLHSENGPCHKVLIETLYGRSAKRIISRVASIFDTTQLRFRKTRLTFGHSVREKVVQVLGNCASHCKTIVVGPVQAVLLRWYVW